MPKPSTSKVKKSTKGSKSTSAITAGDPKKQILTEEDCNDETTSAKLLVVVDAISGLEGGKLKNEVKYPVEVYIIVRLGVVELGSSQIITIPDDGIHNIDFHVVHNLAQGEAQNLLASEPLKLVVMCKGGKDRPSKRGSSSKGKVTSTSSNKITSSDILLDASLDLLPLLLGEIELEEKVGDLLEVQVRLDGVRPKVPDNILYTTVQSIYNPPGDMLTSDVESVMVTINVLSGSEVTDNEEWSRMIFNYGQITSSKTHPEEPNKRWFSVSSGTPYLSQYRNLLGEDKLKDPDKLIKKSNLSAVKVSWNQINRTFLQANQRDKMMQSLVLQDSIWFLEVYIKMKAQEAHRLQHQEQEENPPKLSYFARLDMSDLLHPGVNCTRVVARLKRIRDDKPEIDPAIVRISPITSTSEYTQNSSAALQAWSAEQSKFQRQSAEEKEKAVDLLGRPCYITVLVELLQSLRPRKTAEQLLASVSEYVQERLGSPPVAMEGSSSPAAYTAFRTKLIENIKFLSQQYESYKHNRSNVEQALNTSSSIEVLKANEKPFMEECGSTCEKNLNNTTPDTAHDNKNNVNTIEKNGNEDKEISNENAYDDINFKKHIVKSGALKGVKQNMQSALATYLRETACVPQNGLCEAYCKVVGETRAIVEEVLEAPYSGGNGKIRATSQELLAAAKEVSEEDDYERAQYFLLKRIHFYNDKNADNWTNLAVVSLRHGDISKAKTALLTALCLQPRHKDALLMSAVLLAGESQYEDATLMFEALTTFHPRSFRAWFAYCCFYESIENKQGSDVCLSFGSVCLKDKDSDDEETKICFWTADFAIPEADGFILTAVYLLSLNLWQLGEMCLKEHRLDTNEDTVPYLYYLAVAHHLQGKYRESNAHLKQAISISWNDENLWNLMGHNLYKSGDWDKAEDCYQLVLDDPNPQLQHYLTFYRMGRIMMEKGDFDKAAKFYIRSVSLSSTPLAWIGLAKACYRNNNMDDVEIAAREANRLDDRAGVPWALLALVNYVTCTQPYIAQQCLTLAEKCGLDDEDLKQEIQRVLHLYGETEITSMQQSSSQQLNSSYGLSYLRNCF